MRRLEINPRKNWQEKMNQMGFIYHSLDGSYWNESACYELTIAEVDLIEKTTNTLHELCIEAVETVIERDWFSRLFISPQEKKMILNSWNKDEISLYGRFDLAWNGKDTPKMLEYNSDTPTSIFEAAIIQWDWLKDCHPQRTQFNSLHERLKKRWSELIQKNESLYFLCIRDSAEDIAQTEYLRDVAHQAGLRTEFLFIEDLGWDQRSNFFVDLEGRKVTHAFKLYPWDWLLKEDFGAYLQSGGLNLIEPAWKRILSTKAILPILWQLFPNHPNLLPAYFEAPLKGNFVRKPAQSREGSNITIYKEGQEILKTEGPQESPDFIYQDYCQLPEFGGKHAVIGSWIIGEEAGGIGIREDSSLITRNLSQFVPHFIGEERGHSWI